MRRVLASLTAALLIVAAAPAQGEYRWEQSDALKIRFKVHRKLFPIPLKLGDASPDLRMKFEPKDDGDRIWGRYGAYRQTLVLLEIPKPAPAKTGEDSKTEEQPPPEGRGRPSKDFVEWVTERDEEQRDRTYTVKNQPTKGRGKTPAFAWWEFTDKQQMTNGVEHFDQLWYNVAAVYDFPDKQVALVARVPVKKGIKPNPTHMKWMETMCQSVEVLDDEDVGDVEADLKRDEFANTPERQQELEKAKANIANLKGWDYFTTPNYIVLYSWDPEKMGKRRDSYKFARNLVDNLEGVRELYMRDYPPHDQMLQVYSVLRVCDNDDEFRKYGETPFGVIGWFNPGSKELVVFDDKMKYFGGDKDVMATTFHEGWHQYAHTYFGSEKTELHRWFDEGTGDYYGGFTRKGKSWAYKVDKGRRTSILSQVSRGNFIPLREIVSWNKDKFYGPRAPDHYAQGYSLIDFFRRGPEVLGKRFDEKWTKVLDTYRATMLETKDQKKAVEKAFEGIDFAALEATWIEWVRTQLK